jgi:hypothetical protein
MLAVEPEIRGAHSARHQYTSLPSRVKAWQGRGRPPGGGSGALIPLSSCAELVPIRHNYSWYYGGVMSLSVRALVPFLATRSRVRPPSTVVLHATAGSSLSGAVSWLRLRGLSYHYIVDKDGSVHKCAPVSRVAFHAGRSIGPEGPDVNRYSVGVSLVNMNNGLDPYPEPQFLSAVRLVAQLFRAEPSLVWLTTHAWVSPGRKTDPLGFPAEKCASSASVVCGRAVRVWRPPVA